MREHQSMVFSIAQRIVHDPSLAEEIAQDVFLDLYGRLASFSSREQVLHWLRRVTVHRSIDQARRKPPTPQDHAAVSFAKPGVAERGVPEQGAAALEDARETESETEPETETWLPRRLRQVIVSLPIVPRTVVVLRYQEGMGPEEIAAVLEMPVSTVKSDLQRALTVLRGKMHKPLRGGEQRPRS
jgi:RNA polymerase sigma-70 factor, ECF subfamily